MSRPLLLWFWLWLLVMESWWVLSLRALTLNVTWHSPLVCGVAHVYEACTLECTCSVGELIVHDDVVDD